MDELFTTFFSPDDGGGAVSPEPAAAAEPAPSSDPAPAQSDPAAGGPDVSGLPAAQQNAFSKKWAAERQKLESSLRAQFEQELAQRAPMQQAQALPELPPPPTLEIDEAAIAQMKEQIVSEFYDDPLLAFQKLQKLNNEIETKQAAHNDAMWSYQANTLARKYQDWKQIAPRMQELLKASPDLAERPEQLERLYHLAKTAMPAAAQTAAPTLEQILQNPEFKTRLIEALQPEIINGYVNGKRGTAKNSPPVMGGSPGGTAPALPPSQPKTWADSKRSALTRMRGN